MDELDRKIELFFAAEAFGVVGATNDQNKYGHKVLKCYLQHNKVVYPVNPKGGNISGLLAVKDVTELPSIVTSISVITNPAITREVVPQAILKGIKNIWLQRIRK